MNDKLLQDLLAPIPGDNPSGVWLRYDHVYDQIAEARREDDDLDQGVWKTDLKKANWTLVKKLCIEALRERSKDLQLAVWLMEAFTVKEGFVGVREGLTLVAGLCEHYWDTLYPELDGEDVERRIAPIDWLNEKYSFRLKQIPITQPDDSSIPQYAWTDWEGVLAAEQFALRNPSMVETEEDDTRPTREKFRRSMLATPVGMYTSMLHDLSSITEISRNLESFLDEKCGRQSPSFRHCKETIASITRFVQDILRERKEEVGDTQEEGSSLTEEQDEYGHDYGQPVEAVQQPSRTAPSPHPVAMAHSVMEHSSSGPIRSRAEAYARLAEAANYLMSIEPHSPTPYLVKRAISWGNMSLPDLLNELVFDQNDRMAIFTLLGMDTGNQDDRYQDRY